MSLIVGGVRYSGWKSIRATRSLDHVPSDFEIVATERYPTELTNVIVTPGQPCQLALGADAVINGYVDRYISRGSATEHTVGISGRSKCEDIVDSSITDDLLHGLSMTTGSLLDLATKLCAPFNISVTSLTGDNVPVTGLNGGLLNFGAQLTQTPFELIEEVARYAGVLVYDGADGNLIIANVGTSTMASGIEQGVNVESWQFSNGLDQRYSVYLPHLMSTAVYGDNFGIGGVPMKPAYDTGVSDQKRSDGKPRYRPLIVVSEQFAPTYSLAEKRAQWEAARRYGRSQVLRVTVDAWRDVKGTLWAPNAYAPISIAAAKLTPSKPWVIGEVTFTRDGAGTHAELILMPPEAFQPEPVILTPFSWDPTATPPPATGAAVAPATSPFPGF